MTLKMADWHYGTTKIPKQDYCHDKDLYVCQEAHSQINHLRYSLHQPVNASFYYSEKPPSTTRMLATALPITTSTFFSPPKASYSTIPFSRRSWFYARVYTYALRYKRVVSSLLFILHRRCAVPVLYSRSNDRFRISVARFFFSTVPRHYVVFSVQMCHALGTASSVRMISGCPNCCCKRARTRVRGDLPCHYYVNGRRYYCCTLRRLHGVV